MERDQRLGYKVYQSMLWQYSSSRIGTSIDRGLHAKPTKSMPEPRKSNSPARKPEGVNLVVRDLLLWLWLWSWRLLLMGRRINQYPRNEKLEVLGGLEEKSTWWERVVKACKW